MAERRPLVMIDGLLKELPPADTLPAVSHPHAISDVSGLRTALDAKQAALGFKITVSTTEPSSPATGDIWISY